MICTLCGTEFDQRIAAISRKNDYICPDCGTREALESIPKGIISEKRKEEIYALTSKINKEHYK